jgi:hypothetical protein
VASYRYYSHDHERHMPLAVFASRYRGFAEVHRDRLKFEAALAGAGLD